MKRLFFFGCFAAMISAGFSQKPVFQSNAFSIYPNSVKQGSYEAKAISSVDLVSNYQSPANLFQSADIIFKFAINGKDNEMLSGKDHHFTVDPKDGKAETPVIKFGTQLNQTSSVSRFLKPNTVLKIRLNMRDVLKQLNEKGYYTTFNNVKIYKEDFKGVYVAGSAAPLMWDFDNLYHHDELKLKDDDRDGIYETTLVLNKQSDEKHTDAEWKLSKDLSAYPHYQSDYQLSDAVYNLSLEEMLKAIEADSTFRTGKEWSGVWTRDISYSIILSMAHLQPRVAMNSLLRKVNKKKKIIQDTGTGGAWPASTDRMIWAVAAWEVYKETGNKDWLEQAYVIIKQSIDDDLQNVYDPVTGMVKGESSFLDWREQTYPKWMQPADIFESECLGTNAVHYQANVVLSEMAILLNEKAVAEKHKLVAEKIKAGINNYLWMPEKGYYAQYLYGRNYKILSPRAEALGEALCVLFGIADAAKAKQIIARTPVTAFGIPCIYPQIPNIPPYHNNAVWPFVQSYWLLAAATVKNDQSVMESIAAIYRSAAIFLTNKENFVAGNGDFNGTQINSSVMLWSLSGNLSLVYKLLFGIRFERDRLLFQPYVPKALQGKRTLSNFAYRDVVLDIEMEGYGSRIISFELDGKQTSSFSIPASMTGKHKIKIVLDRKQGSFITNQQPVVFSTQEPVVKYENQQLKWAAAEQAVAYKILKNGKLLQTSTKTNLTVVPGKYAEYQVIAIGRNKTESFASEPVQIVKDKFVSIYQAETVADKSNLPYKGFDAEGFVETSNTMNKVIKFRIQADVDGFYALDFRYANGNGPTNTENKCAIRTLMVDGKPVNSIVFPQRGTGEWSNWGYSNSLQVKMAKGEHVLTLSLEEANENMNGDINEAMIDYLRLMLISAEN